MNNTENKYYTAESDDIKLGATLHILSDDQNIWVKHEFSESSNFTYIIHKLWNKKIQVKYLDQSDIESLGWKFTGKSIDTWFTMEGSFDMGSWTAYKAILHYGFHDQRLTIDVDDSGDTYTLFCGKCNNINELKKLMKQIGIK